MTYFNARPCSAQANFDSTRIARPSDALISDTQLPPTNHDIASKGSPAGGSAAREGPTVRTSNVMTKVEISFMRVSSRAGVQSIWARLRAELFLHALRQRCRSASASTL